MFLADDLPATFTMVFGKSVIEHSMVNGTVVFESPPGINGRSVPVYVKELPNINAPFTFRDKSAPKIAKRKRENDQVDATNEQTDRVANLVELKSTVEGLVKIVEGISEKVKHRDFNSL